MSNFRELKTSLSHRQEITKMFKEDWRIIFECLIKHIHDNLSDEEFISPHQCAEIRKKIFLSQKIMPKFIDPNCDKYHTLKNSLDNLLDLAEKNQRN